MIEGLRFQRPVLPASDAIERYLALSREERWFSNFGPCSDLLRTRLTSATKRPCVPVSNATLGLIVAVAALRGRAPSDAGEALVPSFAFAASAQAAVWNGLQPVFVDVHADNWHLDTEALEAALRSRKGRVAVVIALSTFGVPPPPAVREGWEAACRHADVPLIVDSAAGYGALAADGVPIGSQGDVEVVSFHALKPVSAGEGGAVFCRDDELADEVASLANFAFDEHHQVTRPDGLNAKLSEPAAAIALASLDGLQASLEIRSRLASEILSRLPADFQQQVENARGTWQFVPVAAPDSAARAAVLEEATRRQIGIRTYYDPLHLMPAFSGCARAGDLSVTEALASRMLSLPMALDLESDEITAIADMVRDGVGSAVTASSSSRSSTSQAVAQTHE
ncbi:MAG TPA: aminotransferase class I/II-fold pyridoxal phosphate-dependent enzyme [Plantibacter sp.]|uniref:DegT/DnrJ/EryC1/StrS family aminotransferase n=1 Tax=Plantibacter sp. TaxID=1871045 RepID=UPI002C8B7BCC|nr:aminotransferase class I/II-fold pyridoxal phosphate-dependent enzyme [Plantibacter sp.]